MIVRPFLLCLALIFVAACSMGEPDPQEDDLAILFVGNSLTYTNDLPGILRDLLKETGTPNVVIESIAEPNFGLEDHWYTQSTIDRIKSQPWDYVVLQQGPSATEGRPSLIEYTRKFEPIIRTMGAVPALYMVWPDQTRPFDFAGVLDSYRAAADSVDGLFFPAGAAWLEYFDRSSDVQLYGPDGFHPTAWGSYLAAVVMWEQISGGDANDLDLKAGTEFGSVKFTILIGKVLHDAAHAANVKYALSTESGKRPTTDHQ